MSATIQRTQVVIIGAGQAGLSASYCLSQRGISQQVIFEKNKVAHSWSEERWDSFCLVTPNFQCRLPGHPYDGDDPQGFMVKEQIVDYMQRYRQKIEAPIYEGVTVLSVRKGDGIFVVNTTIGTWHCDDVICAIGSFHTPIIPPGQADIPAHIQQIYATQYKNPQQIAATGQVAVIGSGQSGCQIAEELHRQGRPVHLFLGNAPRSPRMYRGKDSVTWLEEMKYYDITFAEHPDQSKALSSTNHYLTGRDGGREIDLRSFAQDGMKLYGYLEHIDAQGMRARPDTKEKLDSADQSYLGICQRIDDYIEAQGIDAPPATPYQACWQPPQENTQLNFAEHDISAIIWCIGFKPNFSFIELEIFNLRGFPQHDRGLTAVPGLYFLGLPWQHTWGSARFASIAQDADYIAQQIEHSIPSTPAESYYF